MNKIRYIITLLSLFICAPVFAFDSQALTLPTLLKSFSIIQHSTVDFTEEKYASFLSSAVTSSGQLEYTAPNKLAKFVKKPEVATYKIQGNELTMISEKGTHVISLKEHPEFSIILESIIYLMSGNHAKLKSNFKTTFTNSNTGWSLNLIPINSHILGYVASIEMSGTKSNLHKIIVSEPNNDQTITQITNHR